MKKLLGISIKKRLYFTSSYTQCFWKILSNKTFDIKFYKMNKDMNKYFFNKNKDIFEKYHKNLNITNWQKESLLANNKKIFITLEHPLICIDKIYCITETSYPAIIRGPLSDKDIFEYNKSAYHKADKIIIETFEGKNYAFMLWKLTNENKIEIYSLEERVPMDPEQLERFKIFLNSNIDKFKEYNLSWYTEPLPLLESLIEFNINKNLENIKLKDE